MNILYFKRITEHKNLKVPKIKKYIKIVKEYLYLNLPIMQNLNKSTTMYCIFDLICFGSVPY